MVPGIRPLPPATTPASRSLTEPSRLGLDWPLSCPHGHRPLCLPGALLHVSGTLLGSLPPKIWPGRGLPRSQSWWPILRRRALHPQIHEHLPEPAPPCLEAGLSSVPGVSVSTKRGLLRAPPWNCDLSLSAWSGSWSAGGGRGTSGPSCAQPGQATPTHSALLPQSRLLRAWAAFCLCAQGAEGQGDRSGGRRLGQDPLPGDSQPACLRSPHSWTQVLGPKQTTRVRSVPPCLPGRGRACPLCAWQLDLSSPASLTAMPPTQSHACPSRGPHGWVTLSPWALGLTLGPQPHTPESGKDVAQNGQLAGHFSPSGKIHVDRVSGGGRTFDGQNVLVTQLLPLWQELVVEESPE